MTAPVAVIMTLHEADSLPLFDVALASITAQDYAGDIRIYLCVDGPLPETHEAWLATNAAAFHQVLRNPENLGLARSLNRLIDALEDEEFVFRMDGDDISLPHRFRKQAEFMRANPTYDLIGCQVEDIDEAGRHLGWRPFPVNAADTHLTLRRLLPVAHPTFCIRRAMLHDPKIRYPDAHLCEDLAFLVILSERGRIIANHPEVLFQWRTGARFFARRHDWRRGWAELRWYLRAVRAAGRLLSPELVFPVARFVLRLLPGPVLRVIYRSDLREMLLRAR